MSMASDINDDPDTLGAKRGPKPQGKGLPWPNLTVNDERVLMAVIKHGDVWKAAAAMQRSVSATHGAMSRARLAMGGVSTIHALLAYQRFRLTGSAR